MLNKFKDYLQSVSSFFTGFFNRKITVISTFNGIGSFSESLKQMGIDFKMLKVCEIDEDANNTYYQNNKLVKSRHIDDIRVLLDKIKKMFKVDILVQTPPCQSFSLAGSREGFKSDNGNLFLTSIELQKKVDSNIVIYENVKGLVSHHKTHYIYLDKNGIEVEFDSKPKKETIKKEGLQLVRTIDLSQKSLINKEFDGKKKSIGHTLHTIEKLLLEDTRYNYYWKVVGSNEVGLPQNRERIFIFGIKKELDKGNFTFPKNMPLHYTVEDIIEENPDESTFYNNENNHELILHNQEKKEGKIHTYGKYDKTMTYESTRRVSYPYVSPTITL